jgi:DNA ligase D-like protein (predicted 3'-phosphoesterase)
MTQLQTYKEKRDFHKTPEPQGKTTRTRKKKDIFVVQQHKATRDHFDFRLKVGRVLKSWAVPKGIPVEQAEKHLAVETEDHPLEYADFEGKIPKGEYGAGKVKIYDHGDYRNIRKISMQKSYENGQIEVYLNGDRLKGRYALIRTGFNNNPKNWLLIKMRDDKYTFENG